MGSGASSSESSASKHCVCLLLASCKYLLQEEGIIIKAADSPWVTNDRSSAWVKLKPDYVKQSELDAVIIGGLYGKRQKSAGKITEFLLALAEEPLDRSQAPSRFITFCR